MPILSLDRDEASLVRYALLELSYRRAEQAVESRRSNPDFASANEAEARKCRALADRLDENFQHPIVRIH